MTNRMILNETSWFGRGAVNELVPEVLGFAPRLW
ncbi:lactaldehyde reductase [Hafnia alvei]|uniref:Lactaldehyde reductase n=1 Tax=Hafnia alvei TaxID=569 RepID=A0A1C6YXX1_HAFAL|nr:lactaldehyde reductase [Hafnia alvei]